MPKKENYLSDLFQVSEFQSLSIIMPVMDETTSLLETVAVLQKQCHFDIHEIILAVSSQTEVESLTLCEDLVLHHPKLYRIHLQKLPFLGGALRECFDLAQGSHTVVMSSDLETDPNKVKELIHLAKAHPASIITVSRWMKGGSFNGYDRTKLFLNSVFQKFFALLYRCRLTDMTYGFRCFPTSLLQAIHWEELKHPFLFETLVKPLKLKVPVLEIPAAWNKRREGKSHNPFLENFNYFKVGFRVLFQSKKQILKHKQV